MFNFSDFNKCPFLHQTLSKAFTNKVYFLSNSLSLSLSLSLYIYIYIYIEREREREMPYIFNMPYIYIIYIYIYISNKKPFCDWDDTRKALT